MLNFRINRDISGLLMCILSTRCYLMLQAAWEQNSSLIVFAVSLVPFCDLRQSKIVRNWDWGYGEPLSPTKAFPNQCALNGKDFSSKNAPEVRSSCQEGHGSQVCLLHVNMFLVWALRG